MLTGLPAGLGRLRCCWGAETYPEKNHLVCKHSASLKAVYKPYFLETSKSKKWVSIVVSKSRLTQPDASQFYVVWFNKNSSDQIRPVLITPWLCCPKRTNTQISKEMLPQSLPISLPLPSCKMLGEHQSNGFIGEFSVFAASLPQHQLSPCTGHFHTVSKNFSTVYRHPQSRSSLSGSQKPLWLNDSYWILEEVVGRRLRYLLFPVSWAISWAARYTIFITEYNIWSH